QEVDNDRSPLGEGGDLAEGGEDDLLGACGGFLAAEDQPQWYPGLGPNGAGGVAAGDEHSNLLLGNRCVGAALPPDRVDDGHRRLLCGCFSSAVSIRDL